MATVNESTNITSAKRHSNVDDLRGIRRARKKDKMISLGKKTKPREIILLLKVGMGVCIPGIILLGRGYVLGASNEVILSISV